LQGLPETTPAAPCHTHPQLDPISSLAKWGTAPPLRIRKTKANSQQNLRYKRPRKVKGQLLGLVCARDRAIRHATSPYVDPTDSCLLAYFPLLTRKDLSLPEETFEYLIIM